MWKCEICGENHSDETVAVEVRFGYVDEEIAQKEGNSQYDAFFTENAWAPLCDNCAVAYIKGGIW